MRGYMPITIYLKFDFNLEKCLPTPGIPVCICIIPNILKNKKLNILT